jgi:hypothetical protein
VNEKQITNFQDLFNKKEEELVALKAEYHNQLNEKSKTIVELNKNLDQIVQLNDQLNVQLNGLITEKAQWNDQWNVQSKKNIITQENSFEENKKSNSNDFLQNKAILFNPSVKERPKRSTIPQKKEESK